MQPSPSNDNASIDTKSFDLKNTGSIKVKQYMPPSSREKANRQTDEKMNKKKLLAQAQLSKSKVSFAGDDGQSARGITADFSTAKKSVKRPDIGKKVFPVKI